MVRFRTQQARHRRVRLQALLGIRAASALLRVPPCQGRSGAGAESGEPAVRPPDCRVAASAPVAHAARRTAAREVPRMSEILFLAHRVPYPPTKGDKIRSWHLLSGLARRCTVHLGAFVDDPADWDRLDGLRAACGELCLRPLARRAALARGLAGLARGAALTTGYYRDRGLSEWA